MKIDPLIFRAKFPETCRLEQCRSRCCRFGVWADTAEMRNILSNRDLFLPYVRPEAADPSSWFGRTEPDTDCPSGMAVETVVVGDACAFFHPNHGCALQKGAIEAGLHEWRFKPRFCVMFPLVLSEGTLTVDEEMKSLWCMKAKNRTHPITDSVRKEVRFLFGQEMLKTLTRSPQPR
ncbi:MAG: DUF3109 family protein [Deltaproteobacteria bacterium]|nr:DUF3109 family protein [Deltaproteobacteria bacterium]